MKIEILMGSIAGRILLLSAFTFPILTNVQYALLMLFGAFVADFFTGWLATYMEIKRGVKPMPKSGYSFESARARDSVVKGIGYVVLILGSAAMEYVFFDRKFAFSRMSEVKTFGITELVIGFCFVIELYSTVMENLKRAGFDIAQKVSNAADSIWNLIKKVKGKKE